jgi:N-methylhydantoinase B
VATEVLRRALQSAAEQMKRAYVRTAFSPIIYEARDFATALYDRDVNLLAESSGLPLFMGTMSFCVRAAVDAVGGPDELEPGDIVLYNAPYGTGSHPQDLAVVMPVFDGVELVGYATLKGHWLDIGGKEPYSTDTVDVFQEGTIFPGVKLYSRGRLVRDVYRLVTANSRVPKLVAGDLNAEVVGVRTGGASLLRVIERSGLERFRELCAHMFDAGEALVRSYFDRVPDGRYVGHGVMDDNGRDEELVPFEVALEITGSDVRVDYTNAPDQSAGPINCPQPSTVSASRIAVAFLAGTGESPNEGHFRPIDVATRPGSLFHPLHPAPCFLYGWSAQQAVEVIFEAVAQVLPDAVPACSGGDTCGLVWWGRREATGEPWADGSPHPVGQGASRRGDGASSLIHVTESATRFSPVEIWEARNPWLLETVRLAPDSCGPGMHRGGLGVDFHFRMLEDSWVTTAVDRTLTRPWGVAGGGTARPNGVAFRHADGTGVDRRGKGTRVHVPRGATLELHTGGGGGYGEPSCRDPAAVLADVREGYVTEAHARRWYPHVFADSTATDHEGDAA